MNRPSTTLGSNLVARSSIARTSNSVPFLTTRPALRGIISALRGSPIAAQRRLTAIDAEFSAVGTTLWQAQETG